MEDIYEEEMHKTLQRKELALPKPVNGSLQCKYRSVLVSWIQDVSRFFELTMTSCHLAVALMDYFMEDDTVPTDHPFLVAICCVQIGGMLHLSVDYAEKNVVQKFTMSNFATKF